MGYDFKIRRDPLLERSLPDTETNFSIICCEDSVVAGIGEASDLFLSAGADPSPLAKDGDRVRAGTRVLSVYGSAGSVLSCRSAALAILSRMSGIASYTADLVDQAAGRIIIAAPACLTPGLEDQERMAVLLGGGDPNAGPITLTGEHIKLCGGMRNAMERISKASFAAKIRAEAGSPEDAALAVSMGADIISVRGTPEKCAEIGSAAGGGRIVEAAGDIGNPLDYIGIADAVSPDGIITLSGYRKFRMDL